MFLTYSIHIESKHSCNKKDKLIKDLIEEENCIFSPVNALKALKSSAAKSVAS